MKASSVLRTGLPGRRLVLRVLIPLSVVLLAASIPAVFWIQDRLIAEDATARESTARTVFETHWTVTGTADPAGELRHLDGYERIWVLDATGYVLGSNRPDEVGHRIDAVWWRHIEPLQGGSFSERVPFGDETMLLSGIRDTERGRSVVLLQEAPSRFMPLLLSVVGVLALSLTIWLVVAFLVGSMVGRRISGPLEKLDTRALQVIRGESLSDAALDRLAVESTPLLGGHAEVFVDLSREVLATRARSTQFQRSFETLFEALPEPGLIRSRNGTLLAVNQALCDVMNLEKRWLVGRPFSMLGSMLPIRLLESWFSRLESGQVGVNRMELFPGEAEGISDPMTVTLQPLEFGGEQAWLILVDRRRATTDAVVLDGPGGDGASGQTEDPPNLSHLQGSRTAILERILESLGTPAVVFDAAGDALLISQPLLRISGHSRDDLSTLKAFIGQIPRDKQERSVFRAWIESEPTARSVDIRMNTVAGVRRAYWSASEDTLDDGTSIGIFTARIEGATGFTRKTGEPGTNVRYS